MNKEVLASHLERQARVIEALRAANHGIVATFEAEETVTPHQVYCLLDCLINEVDAARREIADQIQA
jgi:hypothetical protein